MTNDPLPATGVLAPAEATLAPAIGRAGRVRPDTIAGVASVAVDVLGLGVIALAAWLGGGGVAAWALGALVVMPMIAALDGCSDRRLWGLGSRPAAAPAGPARALLLACAALIGAGVAGSAHDVMWPLLVAAAAAAGVAVLRAAVRPMLVAALGPERVIVVGHDVAVDQLAGELSARRDAELIARTAAGGALDVLAARPVDHVVAAETLSPDTLDKLVSASRRHGVRLSFAVSRPNALVLLSGLHGVQPVALLAAHTPAAPAARALKRMSDLVLAGAAMLVAAPLMAVIALAVRIDSPGLALFRQTRVGRDGRLFVMFKFRTMVADAEQRRSSLLALSRDPDWLLLDADPRVTCVGRLLRRTSLDELPQLWNVLRGDMSLVGPRPLIPVEHERALSAGRIRSEVAPGITGLWQVNGRTSIPFEDMLRLDRVYVTTWSLRGDLGILLRTVPAVLLARGVN
jgi:lipopolysaccharide/colanic/teichoic acid biosynthesis glycosyltransferase